MNMLNLITMNVPNLITLIRFLLIPIFVILFFNPQNNGLFYSMIVFAVSGISDMLDGYIARKYNLITKLGTVLDPLADKLMLIAVLSCLAIKNYIPLWVIIFIMIKELTMIIGGLLLLKDNTVIPSNFYGKLSTFLFYVSILILIFNKGISKIMIYISVLISFIALINYLIIYKKKILYK